ncbi:hypothetical protein [Paenibacillus oceani]|uniref:Uncharacterized protein n=1 Tax=Paenibacillus oceani TaxID=2772510 RepID=A0A927H1M9_9BACL|nr:hypothetical protein [Paenibacillus oceani]MBD2864935.1 hypothetical protein [Paenibacillus oceani]
MLLLGSRTITVEGITIFPDHADPSQFWYLPGPVQLARRGGRAAFTFIKYKPAAVAAGAKGGGFLMFEVNLRLDPDLERRILSKLRALSKERPKLAAVPFDEGTVQCIALNVQGAGGTAATEPAGPGSFHAVEKILGASVPSLHGENTAAFSLTLSQEGATILEKAFAQGTQPVGVIYDLKFTGMRPALNVEITADLERVYNQLSAGLEAQVYFVRAGIDAAFEKLVQDGAIHIKVVDFTGEEDEKEKERWALDFFKENLLRQWFEPTLTPGQVAGGAVQPESLDQVLRRGNELRPPATPVPPRPDAAPATPAPGTAGGAAARAAVSPTQGTGRGETADGHNPTPPAATPAAGVSPTEGTGFPAASAVPASPAAVGVSVPPSRASNLPAGVASAPGGIGSPALVSFKLRFVHQEERKHIKLVYDRSEATQRTYAPQGFFGLLVADLERGKHFVEVDLDDPFFRVFTIQAETLIDFDRIGLNSAHLSLNYGNAADPATLKHKDFVFDKTRNAPQTFEVFMNERLDTDYEYSVQYHFNPQSDWDGSRMSYDLPPRRIEDRTLLLNPFESIGFLEVQIRPASVDWGVVDSIDVHLAYRPPGGAAQNKQLVLTQSLEALTWKLRLDDRTFRSYTYRFVHHLKDGTTRETEPVTSEAALIPVDDPFPGTIKIEFIPLFESAKIKMVYIDVVYDDPEHQYRREERLKMAGNQSDSVQLVLALLNPALKTFRYQLTFIGTDNSMRRVPFAETAETLIPVQEGP